MSTEDKYQKLMHNALEDVFVVAVRRGLDTRQLVAEFDPEHGPGPHHEHTLTISVRDTSVVVTTSDIPHDWLSIGTGYIDTRFSHRITALLSDLERQAHGVGRFI